jgi:hypothetical protein
MLCRIGMAGQREQSFWTLGLSADIELPQIFVEQTTIILNPSIYEESRLDQAPARAHHESIRLP